MITFAVALLCFVLGTVCLTLWRGRVAARREEHIRRFTLPKGLFERLRAQHPGLSLKDCQLAAHALRQFFLAHLKSGRGHVAMPSRVVDDLWHGFILYTLHYERFCGKAFGRFMHHLPAVGLGEDERDDAGLRRCWRFVCLEENIDPQRPTRLPLLFAIDGKLGIEGGWRYVADGATVRRLRTGRDDDGGSCSGGGSGGGSSNCSSRFDTTADLAGCGGGSGGDGGGDGGGGGCGGGGGD